MIGYNIVQSSSDRWCLVGKLYIQSLFFLHELFSWVYLSLVYVQKLYNKLDIQSHFFPHEQFSYVDLSVLFVQKLYNKLYIQTRRTKDVN